jgi:hypothetical protein
MTLGDEATLPRPLPCVPSELLTDLLEMRTTASMVTMSSGMRNPRRQRAGGAVLIPR